MSFSDRLLAKIALPILSAGFDQVGELKTLILVSEAANEVCFT